MVFLSKSLCLFNYQLLIYSFYRYLHECVLHFRHYAKHNIFIDRVEILFPVGNTDTWMEVVIAMETYAWDTGVTPLSDLPRTSPQDHHSSVFPSHSWLTGAQATLCFSREHSHQCAGVFMKSHCVCPKSHVSQLQRTSELWNVLESIEVQNSWWFFGHQIANYVFQEIKKD